MKRLLVVLLCTLLLLGAVPGMEVPAKMDLLSEITSVVPDSAAAFIGDFVVWSVAGTWTGLRDVWFVLMERMGGIGGIGGYRMVEEYHGVNERSHGFYLTKAGTYFVGASTNLTDGSGTVTGSAESADVTVTPRPAPGGVQAQAVGGSAIYVHWDAMPGATGYEVWRGLTKAGPYRLAKKTTATGWANTYLTAGKQYFFKVRPTNTGVPSGLFTAPVAAVPLARAAIQSATATGRRRARLVLTPVTGATGYEILVSSSASGPYTPLRYSTAPAVTLTGLVPGRAYFFKARAYKWIAGFRYFGPVSAYKYMRQLQ